MEWARESIDIVVLSMGLLVGMKKTGNCRLAYTLPFHRLYYVAEFFTYLSILVELRLEMLEDSLAKRALRRRV